MHSKRRATKRPLSAVAACLVLAMLPRIAFAVEAGVEDAVRALLQEETRGIAGDVEISLLPTNGRFPPCPAARAFLPRGRADLSAGRLSVGVRCGEQGQQVRYVPVRISVYGSYFEVTQELQRGDTVDASILEQRRGDLSQLPAGAVRSLESVVGQQASRRLTPGTVLLERHVRRVPLVERGQRVVVEYRGAGFVVSREGQALDGGSLGDTVRVRFGRREIVSATVSAKGRLRVDQRR